MTARASGTGCPKIKFSGPSATLILVGVGIEASQIRTASYGGAARPREQAQGVVPNSSCPDPVPHSRANGLRSAETQILR